MASSAWQPFRHAEFRRLWHCTFAMHLANWMQQVAAASLMTSLTPSPAMAALVQTAASLPAVLFGLPAGVLADLIERRRWLIFTQCWLLAAAALFCGMVAAGGVGPLGLLALTGLLGVGFALQTPASQAVLSESVPRDQMPAALALAGISFNAARVAGPALAGALIGLAGGGAVYGVVACFSLLVLAFLVRWQAPPRPPATPAPGLWRALGSGLDYVRRQPECRVQLMHTLIFMSCGSAAWALLPVIARDLYRLGAGGYGLLLGAFGVGGVMGVFVLAALRRRLPLHRVVALSALAFAAVTALLAVAPPLWLAVTALVAGGMAWMAGASSIYAALQASLQDWVRARGLSIYNMVYFLAMAGGAAAWGALTDLLGTRGVLGASAASLLVATLWFWRRPLTTQAILQTRPE